MLLFSSRRVMKVPRVPPDHQDLKAERDGLD